MKDQLRNEETLVQKSRNQNFGTRNCHQVNFTGKKYKLIDNFRLYKTQNLEPNLEKY